MSETVSWVLLGFSVGCHRTVETCCEILNSENWELTANSLRKGELCLQTNIVQ